jgi:isopentenyldiphosphate isomerase
MVETESFAVVDDKDDYMYTVKGKEQLHRNSRLHRSIHLIIEVFGGKIIIQKKAPHTENGGKWSSAVSGHVRLGEACQDTVIREAKEELGIDIDKIDLINVAKVSPSEETGNEFVSVYTYLLDPEKEDIRMACDEVDELITCHLKDLIADVKKNEQNYSPAFIVVFNVFLTLYKEDMEEVNNVS